MATFNKIADFVLNLATTIDLNGDVMQLAFSATAPGAETTPPTGDGAGVLANVTQIAYTNWGDDLTADRVLTSGSQTHAQVAGVYTWDYTADIVITAVGGAIASFRYIYMFDNTVATPVVDPLVNYWDHGALLALAQNDTATLQIAAGGILTLT